MNTVLLMKKIAAEGFTVSQVADKLGISRQGFYMKVHGQREFRASELGKMKRLLDLSYEDMDAIYFGEDAYVQD